MMKYVSIGRLEGATLACGGGASLKVSTRTASSRSRRSWPTSRLVCAWHRRKSLIRSSQSFPAVHSTRPLRSRTGQYGLSASIYTQDVNRAFAAMRDIYTGVFYVNAPTIGAEVHLPFGGTKNTGNGHREGGTRRWTCFGVEVSLCGLQRQAAARADRYRALASGLWPRNAPPVRRSVNWCLAHVVDFAAYFRDPP